MFGEHFPQGGPFYKKNLSGKRFSKRDPFRKYVQKTIFEHMLKRGSLFENISPKGTLSGKYVPQKGPFLKIFSQKGPFLDIFSKKGPFLEKKNERVPFFESIFPKGSLLKNMKIFSKKGTRFGKHLP